MDLAKEHTRFDASVKRALTKKQYLDSYGTMVLFLTKWASSPTYDGARSVINKFGLTDFGDPNQLEETYPDNDAVGDLFIEISEKLNESEIAALNRASGVEKVGGNYAAGWNGRDFGLLYYADPVDVDALIDRFKKKKRKASAVAPSEQDTIRAFELTDRLICVEGVVKILKSIDFGHTNNVDLDKLELAADSLRSCGVVPKDVEGAIRYFQTDPEKARNFIYGPSGRGSNKGALVDLLNMHTRDLRVKREMEAERLQLQGSKHMTQKTASLVYAGYLYEETSAVEGCGCARSHDESEVPASVDEEYLALLDKMEKTGLVNNRVLAAKKKSKKKQTQKFQQKKRKGVRKCKKSEQDPKKSLPDQEWCTLDSSGRLKGRYKTKEQAHARKIQMTRFVLDNPSDYSTKKLKPSIKYRPKGKGK